MRLEPTAPQSQVKHSTTPRCIIKGLHYTYKICLTYDLMNYKNKYQNSRFITGLSCPHIVDSRQYVHVHNVLNSLHPWQFFLALLSSADFFQNQLFHTKNSEIPSECQIVWNQIRPDILSGLIWLQTVCKSYQQTTLGDKKISSFSAQA